MHLLKGENQFFNVFEYIWLIFLCGPLIKLVKFCFCFFSLFIYLSNTNKKSIHLVFMTRKNPSEGYAEL